MGSDLYYRTVLALIFVVGLISLTGWAIKRYGFAGARISPRNRRRLSLVEALPLDNRRRLLLVRRDGVEHLLLIGGGADLIVETGIATFSDAMKEEAGK